MGKQFKLNRNFFTRKRIIIKYSLLYFRIVKKLRKISRNKFY